MTSFRQIEANRRNATRSTGPVTEAGKHRSRLNAVRHGLCAETVVGMLEDVEDYEGFEAAIIADYDAETAVERELVLRLASPLWRIRRATSIETSLLQTQAEILRDRRRLRGQPRVSPSSAIKWMERWRQHGDVSPGSSHGRIRSPLHPHRSWLLSWSQFSPI